MTSVISKKLAKKIAFAEVRKMEYKRKYSRRVRIKETQHTLSGKTESRDCFEVKVPVKGIIFPRVKILIIDKKTGKILLNAIG